MYAEDDQPFSPGALYRNEQAAVVSCAMALRTPTKARCPEESFDLVRFPLQHLSYGLTTEVVNAIPLSPSSKNGCPFSLAFDVLCTVLSFLRKTELPRAALTCTKWAKACSHPGVWNSIKVAEETSLRMHDVTDLLGPRMKKIQRLNLSNSFGVVTSKGMMALADACPGIVFLDTGSSSALTDAAVIYFAQRAHRLECLYMCQCDYITDTSIKVLLQSCPSLVTLHLSECSNVSAESFLSVENSKLTNMGIRDTGITMETIGAVLRNNRNLKKLWCTRMSSKALIDTLTYCPNLTELHIKDASHISSSSMLQFLKTNIKIIALGLRGFDHGGSAPFLEALAYSSSTLEYLALSDCSAISAHDLVPLLIKCTSLKSLILSPIHDDGVGPELWQQISTHCVNFSQLFVTSSVGKLDAPLLGLASCSRLRRLSLFSCGLSPTVQLPQASPIWSNVRHLSFAYNRNVTDIVVCDALKFCEKLEAIDVDNTDISDLTLVALRLYGHSVLHANVSGCAKITARGFNELKFCSQLISLRCTHLPNVTYDMVSHTIASLKHLRSIGFTCFSATPEATGVQHTGIRKVELTSPLVQRSIGTDWITLVSQEFPQLAWLTLHNTAMTADDLPALSVFPHLGQLEFSGTETFSKQGARAVFEGKGQTCTILMK